MKLVNTRSIVVGLALCCVVPLGLSAYSQEIDTLRQMSTPSLEFRLFGGLGVFYVTDCSPHAFFRLGVDGSWNHSNETGEGNSYTTSTTIYPPGPPSSTAYSTMTKPEQSSTSYSVSLSGVYALKGIGFAHTELYLGVGPKVSFSFTKSSSFVSNIGGGYPPSQTSALDNSEKSWGVGPLVIYGLKHRILDHVGLSAEIDLSLLYTWVSRSTAMQTVTTVPTIPATYNSAQGSTENLTGWNITLSSIAIGVILEL